MDTQTISIECLDEWRELAHFQRRRADKLTSDLVECATQLALMTGRCDALIAEVERLRARVAELEVRNG